MGDNQSIIPLERIERSILFIRGQKVMLDVNLAELYSVSTGNLNKAIKRNIDRFPSDFMFQITAEEYTSLRFQFGILKRGKHSKYLPYAFTEQGVAMLSSVLRSPRAVLVNIEIMRAFVRLREIMATHKDLAKRLDNLEKKYNAKFRIVFDAIRELMKPPQPPSVPKKKIGFLVRDKRASYGIK